MLKSSEEIRESVSNFKAAEFWNGLAVVALLVTCITATIASIYEA